MRRLLLVVFLALASALATPTAARACWCFQTAAGEALANAPIAFVGTVVGGERGSDRTVTIAVERVLKGDVEEGIRPFPNDQSSCGFFSVPGERHGFLVHDSDISSCGIADADALLAAARHRPAGSHAVFGGAGIAVLVLMWIVFTARRAEA